MAHYGLAEYSQAAPYLKSASDRDPDNLSLLLALAHSYLWSEQFNYVMDVYHRILALNAESAEADMLAGEALDEMKDSDGAIKMFRAAAAANPKEPDVHFGLGYLFWVRKQYPEALVEFQAEVGNNPNHAQSLVYLGDCYLQLNKSDDARSPLQEGLALNPSLGIADLDLGIIDSQAGRNDDALRELKKALALMPGDVNVRWRLARLLRAMGRTEEANAEFEAAKKLNKAADEDLYRKIANGKLKNPDDTQTPQPPAAPAQ
jgi:tetratricopeptide (TPR) repeat protein